MVRKAPPMCRASCTDAQYSLALQHISYDGKIENANFCRMTLTQSYYNHNQLALDVEYKFPTGVGMVFDTFEAEFDQKIIKGYVKERKEARQEFEQARAQGELVAYAETDELEKNLMKIDIGNLAPGQHLEIRFTFLQILSVGFNKFWELALPSGIGARNPMKQGCGNSGLKYHDTQDNGLITSPTTRPPWEIIRYHKFGENDDRFKNMFESNIFISGKFESLQQHFSISCPHCQKALKPCYPPSYSHTHSIPDPEKQHCSCCNRKLVYKDSPKNSIRTAYYPYVPTVWLTCDCQFLSLKKSYNLCKGCAFDKYYAPFLWYSRDVYPYYWSNYLSPYSSYKKPYTWEIKIDIAESAKQMIEFIKSPSHALDISEINSTSSNITSSTNLLRISLNPKRVIPTKDFHLVLAYQDFAMPRCLVEKLDRAKYFKRYDIVKDDIIMNSDTKKQDQELDEIKENSDYVMLAVGATTKKDEEENNKDVLYEASEKKLQMMKSSKLLPDDGTPPLPLESYCALVNFIPDFNDSTLEEAYKDYVKQYYVMVNKDDKNEKNGGDKIGDKIAETDSGQHGGDNDELLLVKEDGTVDRVTNLGFLKEMAKQSKKEFPIEKKVAGSEENNYPRDTDVMNDTLESEMKKLNLLDSKEFKNEENIESIESLENDKLKLESAQGMFLFLLDCSGSMGGERIKQAKKALKLFLQSMPLNSKFQVILFGNRCCTIESDSTVLKLNETKRVTATSNFIDDQNFKFNYDLTTGVILDTAPIGLAQRNDLKGWKIARMWGQHEEETTVVQQGEVKFANGNGTTKLLKPIGPCIEFEPGNPQHQDALMNVRPLTVEFEPAIPLMGPSTGFRTEFNYTPTIVPTGFPNDCDWNQRIHACYSSKHVERILQLIDKFVRADHGGTEIYQPLQRAYQMGLEEHFKKFSDNNDNKSTDILPRAVSVFLLTDGQVADTKSVLNLIQKNKQICRTYTIGVGNGCSHELIIEGAKRGGGKHIFVSDNNRCHHQNSKKDKDKKGNKDSDHADMESKIISILEDAITPSICGFELENVEEASFDGKHDFLTEDATDHFIDFVYPNPKTTVVRKNEPISFFFVFNQNFNEKNNKIGFSFLTPEGKKMKYRIEFANTDNNSSNNSNNSSMISNKMIITPNGISNDHVYHKIAYAKMIESLYMDFPSLETPEKRSQVNQNYPKRHENNTIVSTDSISNLGTRFLSKKFFLLKNQFLVDMYDTTVVTTDGTKKGTTTTNGGTNSTNAENNPKTIETSVVSTLDAGQGFSRSNLIPKKLQKDEKSNENATESEDSTMSRNEIIHTPNPKYTGLPLCVHCTKEFSRENASFTAYVPWCNGCRKQINISEGFLHCPCEADGWDICRHCEAKGIGCCPPRYGKPGYLLLDNEFTTGVVTNQGGTVNNNNKSGAALFQTTNTGVGSGGALFQTNTGVGPVTNQELPYLEPDISKLMLNLVDEHRLASMLLEMSVDWQVMNSRTAVVCRIAKDNNPNRHLMPVLKDKVTSEPGVNRIGDVVEYQYPPTGNVFGQSIGCGFGSTGYGSGAKGAPGQGCAPQMKGSFAAKGMGKAGPQMTVPQTGLFGGVPNQQQTAMPGPMPEAASEVVGGGLFGGPAVVGGGLFGGVRKTTQSRTSWMEMKVVDDTDSSCEEDMQATIVNKKPIVTAKESESIARKKIPSLDLLLSSFNSVTNSWNADTAQKIFNSDILQQTVAMPEAMPEAMPPAETLKEKIDGILSRTGNLTSIDDAVISTLFVLAVLNSIYSADKSKWKLIERKVKNDLKGKIRNVDQVLEELQKLLKK